MKLEWMLQSDIRSPVQILDDILLFALVLVSVQGLLRDCRHGDHSSLAVEVATAVAVAAVVGGGVDTVYLPASRNGSGDCYNYCSCSTDVQVKAFLHSLEHPHRHRVNSRRPPAEATVKVASDCSDAVGLRPGQAARGTTAGLHRRLLGP